MKAINHIKTILFHSMSNAKKTHPVCASCAGSREDVLYVVTISRYGAASFIVKSTVGTTRRAFMTLWDRNKKKQLFVWHQCYKLWCIYHNFYMKQYLVNFFIYKWSSETYSAPFILVSLNKMICKQFFLITKYSPSVFDSQYAYNWW